MIVEDLKNEKGLWIYQLTLAGERAYTWSGRKWNAMQQRCKVGGYCQQHRPTYTGCAMSDNFKDYQFFVEWARQQAGYGRDVALDKDLLLKDNKLYSESTCIFIPRRVNSFLTSSKASRGDWPIGVSFNKKSGKFQAGVASPTGGVPYLGRFSTPEEAFQIYKNFKEAEAKRLSSEYRSQLDPRAYEALMNYTININD